MPDYNDVNSTGEAIPPTGAADVERHPSTGISILVVGAGVGGVMAALECWRKGHNVRIVERHPGVDVAGDFFTIGSSAIRVFQNWPALAKENEQIALNPLVSYHRQNGEQVLPPAMMDLGMTGAATDRKLPNRIYRHHRPAFNRMLLQQLARVGLTVEYGQRVVEYYEYAEVGKGGVILESGQKIEADLVIAADGVGTKSHKLISGHAIRARGTGYAIYRTAYPIEVALQDPLVAERFKFPADGQSVMEVWAGPDMHLFVWNTGELMSWTIIHPDDGTAQESWHNYTPIETVLGYTSSVKGWPEVINRLIKTTPAGNLIDWKLLWRDPQKIWFSPAGRVVQLGDSAHTFLPSSGNGGTQAIEDAVSLATCLEIGGKENIPLAVKVHNSLRFERVCCCQRLGVRNQNNFNKTNWEAVAKNPDLLKAKYGYWIWSHDPEAYALENYHKSREHILTGAPFYNTNIPPGYVYRPWTIEDAMAAENSGEVEEDNGDWS